MIEALQRPEVQQFIKDHLYDDPADLMLRASRFPELPMREVAEQIRARLKAKSKLPEWFEAEGLLYPGRVSVEQSSSEALARYKAKWVQGQTMVDLTGGMGVDCFYLSQHFKTAHYVERQETLAALAKYNFETLQATQVSCHHQDSLDFLKSSNQHFDLIYIDPARRAEGNRKVAGFEDCEPNLISLMPLLRARAEKVMIKASPMLDIKKAISDLGGVAEVHVIADRNEVKELLFIDSGAHLEAPPVHCVNLNPQGEEVFHFDFGQESRTEVSYSTVQEYLYEPNATLLKAGAFRSVASTYGLKKLHPNTHLYTADHWLGAFPGRTFKVMTDVALQKKTLRKQLPGMKAHVAVRNYPMSVEAIRKKTGLKEGGTHYVFGFTDQKGPKAVMCQRMTGNGN